MADSARIKAAEGYVAVTVDNSKLDSGLKEAESKCQAFQNKLDGWSVGVGAAITAAFTGVGIALKKMMSETIAYGDKLDKMSQRINVSVESLRQLDVMAQYCGTNIEMLESTIGKMSKKIGEASIKGGESAEVFNRLGVSISSLQAMNPDEAFMSLLTSLAGVSDKSQRTAIAMSLFEESATQLFPLLNQGADGVEDMKKKLDELGITMTTQDATALATLLDSTTTVSEAFKSFQQNILTGLAPALTSISDTIAKVIGFFNGLSKENKKLMSIVVSSVATYGTAIAAMGAWSLAAGKLSGAIKMVSLALKALSANPWVLGLTVGVGAVMALYQAFKKEQPVIEDYINKAESITQKHKEQADSSNALMDRLEELNSKQARSAKEMEEAEQIVNQLTSSYGDLGISVNKATGEIVGLTDAQKKLAEAQKNQKKTDLLQELTAIDKEIKQIDNATNDKVFGWSNAVFEPLTSQKEIQAGLNRGDIREHNGKYYYVDDKDRALLKEAGDKKKALLEQRDAKQQYLDALNSGTDTETRAKEVQHNNELDKQAQSLSDKANSLNPETYESRTKKAEEEYAKNLKLAEDVKNQNIAEGYQQDYIDETYAKMIADAEKIHTDSLAKIESDRQKAEQESQQRIADEEKRLSEATISDIEARYNKGLEDIEGIRTKYSEALNAGNYEEAERLGKEYDKRKAELELEKAGSEQQLAAQKLIEASEALKQAEESGNNEDKIKAREDYKQALSNLQNANDTKSSSAQSLADMRKAEQEARQEEQNRLAEQQKAQREKNQELAQILGQNINDNLAISHSSKGTFSGFEAVSGGINYEEKQLKETQRIQKWSEQIYKELQDWSNKNLQATYA